jgi:DNA-binding MarR family transcriptional regulator
MQLEENSDVRKLFATFERFAKAEWRKQSFQGIKPSELRVLLCIRDNSLHSGQGVTVSEISKGLTVTSPTVTQIIKSLNTNGYVERTVDAKDRRIAHIKLTNTGEQLVQKANERKIAAFTGLLETLGKEQTENLISLLNQAYVYFDEVTKNRQD